MSEGLTLASPNLDQASRAKVIAAMASRLAAAGPRTRERLRAGGVRPANDNKLKHAVSSPGVTRADSWSAPPAPGRPRPWQNAAWRNHTATIRTAGIVAAMGLGGFGLVALALNPHISSKPHQQDVAASAPLPTPQAAQPIQQPAAPRHPARTQAQEYARLSHPLAHKAVFAAASYTPAHRPAPHAATLVTAHADPRPAIQNHAAETPYELPHWLQADDAPKPPLVMSEPPHNLTLPPDYGSAAPQPQAAPQAFPRAMPPAVHPSLIFAWSGPPHGAYANPYPDSAPTP